MVTLEPVVDMMAIQKGRRDSYIIAKRIIDQMSSHVESSDWTTTFNAQSAPIISSDKGLQYTSLPVSTSTKVSDIGEASYITEQRLYSCGWFYPDISREHARSLLERLPVGCFLLRTSSLSNHKYTLSVRVPGGVVNIRIGHHTDRSGLTLYHLDCSRNMSDDTLETNACVVSLIEDLVRLPSLSHYQFTDNRGQTIILELKEPAISQPHSLTHLSRLAINKRLTLSNTEPSVGRKTVASLHLPTRLSGYILQYPNRL